MILFDIIIIAIKILQKKQKKVSVQEFLPKVIITIIIQIVTTTVNFYLVILKITEQKKN